jgi:hypothetical protein
LATNLLRVIGNRYPVLMSDDLEFHRCFEVGLVKDGENLIAIED